MGNPVCVLAFLLAGSFPSLEVLDIREVSPEDCFAVPHLAARTGVMDDPTSSKLPRVPLRQPLAIATARITRAPLSTGPRSQGGPRLQRPPLLRRVSRMDAPSAEPA